MHTTRDPYFDFMGHYKNPEIFSKYGHINIVTDSNISYEITNAVTYNVYVLQNNSDYLNGLIKVKS